MLPGSAILAGAAAIMVFVGVAVKPPGERVGSLAKVAVSKQMQPLPRFQEPGSPYQVARGAAPAEGPRGSELIGTNSLPSFNGHDAQMYDFDVAFDEHRRIPLRMVTIANVSPDDMTDGDEVVRNSRTMHVFQIEGHNAVSTVDRARRGYIFISDALSVDELVDLVSKTGLVGSQ